MFRALYGWLPGPYANRRYRVVFIRLLGASIIVRGIFSDNINRPVRRRDIYCDLELPMDSSLRDFQLNIAYIAARI